MGDLETLREKILLAALPQVPFGGWTIATLAAGAEAAGLAPADAQRAFPGGPVEAIDFFNRYADNRMLEALEGVDLEAMRLRDRIAAAVRLRLEQNQAHKEAVRRAIAVFANPFNAPTALACLHRTVDAIWNAVGDVSADFDWYTKRGLLAGVYCATVLYWLNDTSEEAADSWAFLDRRIADALSLGEAAGRAAGTFRDMPNPFAGFKPPGGSRR